MNGQPALTPAERQTLKGRAHRLGPVVWIGDAGLTQTVFAEVERALAAHALIKVQASGLGREARETTLAELCARCGAQPVQHIGKVLVLYRRKPEPAPEPQTRRTRPQPARTPRPRKPRGR